MIVIVVYFLCQHLYYVRDEDKIQTTNTKSRVQYVLDFILSKSDVDLRGG